MKTGQEEGSLMDTHTLVLKMEPKEMMRMEKVQKMEPELLEVTSKMGPGNKSLEKK